MDRLNMSSPTLPPGFRFHPTDQELIVHYLEKKVSSSSSSPEVSIIADVNIYKFNPWELPGMALFGDCEWFFFSPRDRKYPNGSRPNRAAASGYWKATGTDKPILTSSGSRCIGVKKALVFYKGRPPKGIKTSWMMLEYRLLDDSHQLHRLRGSMRLDDWVLCRVRQKSYSLQQREETYDSSCGSSPPFGLRGLQGQEIMKKNTTDRDYDYDDFQACLKMAPLENEEADEQVQVELQEGSPGYSVSAVGSDSQPPTISSFRDALESIKKVLSLGAFEELVPTPSKKKPNVPFPTNAEHAGIFQVSSPTISASYPWNFSAFMT